MEGVRALGTGYVDMAAIRVGPRVDQLLLQWSWQALEVIHPPPRSLEEPGTVEIKPFPHLPPCAALLSFPPPQPPASLTFSMSTSRTWNQGYQSSLTGFASFLVHSPAQAHPQFLPKASHAALPPLSPYAVPQFLELSPSYRAALSLTRQPHRRSFTS